MTLLTALTDNAWPVHLALAGRVDQWNGELATLEPQAARARWKVFDLTGPGGARARLARALVAHGRATPEDSWTYAASFEDFEAVLTDPELAPADLLDIVFAPLARPGDTRGPALRNAAFELDRAIDGPGGLVGLDPVSDASAALIAAGWLGHIAIDERCVVILDNKDSFSPFLVAAVRKMTAPIALLVIGDEPPAPPGQPGLGDPLRAAHRQADDDPSGAAALAFELLAEIEPSSEPERRLALCRLFCELGQIDLAADCVRPLGQPLSGRATEVLSTFHEHAERPGLLARNHAVLMNLLAIDVLRATMPLGEATARVMLRRLALLERFDRIGIVNDARATAVEAAEILGTLKHMQPLLWEALR